MSNKKSVIIAGSGGIGEAVAILLAELSETPPKIILANRNQKKAKELVRQIQLGTPQSVEMTSVPLSLRKPGKQFLAALEEADLVLDCLPGRFAPQLASLARAYGLHYANLTEHINETRQIEEIAEGAETGFVLQTGLAPGFVNVLANGLFQRFCRQYEVDKVEHLSMNVGALTRHATPPHYYAFTWSPAGVANEYLQPVRCLRNFQIESRPALSERELIYINGRPFESDLTSGGSADLPEALAGKVERLDYKTLRYPGHFDWVHNQLAQAPRAASQVNFLQNRMEKEIPQAEDDIVVLYCYVDGRDSKGVLQRMERNHLLVPQPVGRHRLRAVQAATAAPMAQTASMLLEGTFQGVVRQSQIDPEAFLGGAFVTAVFGKWNGA